MNNSSCSNSTNSYDSSKKCNCVNTCTNTEDNCVPCPCDLLGLTPPLCGTTVRVFENPPRLGQLYTALYTGISDVPTILKGSENIIQNDITDLFIRIGIALIIPTILIFFIIICLLISSGIVNMMTGIIIILLMLFVFSLALVYLYWDINDQVDIIATKVKYNIEDNWNDNKETIINDVLNSYLTCGYCESTINGCTTNCGGICNGACNDGINQIKENNVALPINEDLIVGNQLINLENDNLEILENNNLEILENNNLEILENDNLDNLENDNLENDNLDINIIEIVN